jgi:hypothetical protein
MEFDEARRSTVDLLNLLRNLGLKSPARILGIAGYYGIGLWAPRVYIRNE